MNDRVRVRLVPKSRTGASAHTHFGILAASNISDFAPSPENARTALSIVSLLGIEAIETPRNNLTGFINREDFERTFNTSLIEVAPPSGDLAKGIVSTEGYFQPEGDMIVPAELADAIDFAYIPTPPIFFGLDTVPPQASVYHLRIEDVARILGAYRCHRQRWTGHGVSVAMADTGFAKHPFFDQYDFNITRLAAEPTVGNPEIDTSGHGTGESANVLVIAPDCTFFGIKYEDDAATALEKCLEQQPDLLTNSWGWNIDYETLSKLRKRDQNLYKQIIDVERIIKDAIAAGVTVVFAAGNGQKAFPGSLPEVISVGGATVDADGDISASSYASSFVSKLYPNRAVPDFCGVVGESGPRPEKGHIMLPVPNDCKYEGENMSTSQGDKGWGIFSGTSAAAPQVAGIISLMLSVNSNLTPNQIKGILAATATDVKTGTTAHNETAKVGVDLATGCGLVNALNACLRVQQLLTN